MYIANKSLHTLIATSGCITLGQGCIIGRKQADLILESKEGILQPN